MTHRRFIFNFQKALQAAAYILRLAGGRLPYIDLIKLLYIADRTCLASEGETITGDSVSALKKGPVLSTVLNLIKKKDSQYELWQTFIKSQFNITTKQTEVFVKKDPGEDELYRFEKDILKQVYHEYCDKDLVSCTHNFSEWQKYEDALNDPNTKSSYPISIEDILDAVGKPELIDVVLERLAIVKEYKKMLEVAT
jgi:uncharacterized phage-associated protein